MLLIPDNRLREVQPMLLQHRWIVTTVGEATPNVEATSRQQDSCNVAEPVVEQLIESFVAYKVIR